MGIGEGERERKREILTRTPNFAVKRKIAFFLRWDEQIIYSILNYTAKLKEL